MNDQYPSEIQNVIKYTGFWARAGASIIDNIILLIITVPLTVAVYGWEYFGDDQIDSGLGDFLINFVLPFVLVLLFWVYRQGTPGKMAISARIVDARTGEKPSVAQFIIRYLGYFVSIIPLGLGIFWVAWDSKKQGWHDKLAKTVVVNPKSDGPEEVSFSQD